MYRILYALENVGFTGNSVQLSAQYPSSDTVFSVKSGDKKGRVFFHIVGVVPIAAQFL